MNRETALKISRQIARLVVASDCFQQCLSLLEHMGDLELTMDSHIYPPMMAGIVTTYARNFNSSNGLGPLPSNYEKFQKPALQTAHEKLIDSRNRIYAHRDITKIQHLSNSKDIPVKVLVRAKQSLDGFYFKPIMLDIPTERIPDIRDLIEFQLGRLIVDVSKKNHAITDFDREYDLEHTYELGVDFP